MVAVAVAVAVCGVGVVAGAAGDGGGDSSQWPSCCSVPVMTTLLLALTNVMVYTTSSWYCNLAFNS